MISLDFWLLEGFYDFVIHLWNEGALCFNYWRCLWFLLELFYGFVNWKNFMTPRSFTILLLIWDWRVLWLNSDVRSFLILLLIWRVYDWFVIWWIVMILVLIMSLEVLWFVLISERRSFLWFCLLLIEWGNYWISCWFGYWGSFTNSLLNCYWKSFIILLSKGVLWIYEMRFQILLLEAF